MGAHCGPKNVSHIVSVVLLQPSLAPYASSLSGNWAAGGERQSKRCTSCLVASVLENLPSKGTLQLLFCHVLLFRFLKANITLRTGTRGSGATSRNTAGSWEIRSTSRRIGVKAEVAYGSM